MSKGSAISSGPQSFLLDRDGITAADVFIERFEQRHGVASALVFRARVCVAELAANALEHGATPGRVDELLLELHWAAPSELSISYADSSRPFDPTAEGAVPAALDLERGGGSGLRLLRQFVRASSYSHDGQHNRLELVIKP